ncbi:serine--tRNA ligase [Gammaproteobacteria bacterium]|nr:serine--tRNA ligase [Gammaproteobacteria bacterium]MDA9001120.1 serine--tRNA ligase [Gammaproteobacteria bacterium]MDA9147553.1 serine--tRNA ligase [Gammaproteobacteria bacterium]MDA9932787.1 serine--tRNA ligase [Gammaproteobacteria bacterium]
MINIKNLRDDIDAVASALASRGYELNKTIFIELESERKVLQVEVESLQSDRKNFSNEFGKLKSEGKDTDELKDKIDQINNTLKLKDSLLQDILEKMHIYLLDIPNIPHESTPVGKNEDDNVVLRKHGNILSSNKVDHLDITSKIDTDLAAKLAGSRFAVLKGDIAKLQRALISFMLDTAIKNGYEEYYVPFLANKESLTGTGQLPKFEEDLFKTTDNLYLIPTAEVPLTNVHRDTTIEHSKLPLKLTSHTPCFRSEAGSYGRDTKGLIRQHQFEKIELVQVTHDEDSMNALDGLLGNAEEILQLLELPYQVVELCTGDIGFSSCKTFDIEVWMPSQNKYREISSCSNFSDFQARRANIKVKGENGKNFAHTINGSALAVGRTLIAILENRYDGTDSITLPKVLKPYIENLTIAI